MATTTDPYTRDRTYTTNTTRNEIRRTSATPMWLWPLLALAALSLLGLLFYRGMQRTTPTYNRPAVTQPARSTAPVAPVREAPRMP